MDENLKNARVLIVDDQQSNIDILADLLEVNGYDDITRVTDPRNVIPMFTNQEFDILLLDLMMPQMSGYEVMEKLKSILPDDYYLPILVLTADASEDARKHALNLGASDFLTKPFDLTEVSLRIRNLLFTKFLFRQLHDQNKILEEKVKERTFRLEKINEELVKARDNAEAGNRLKTAFIQNISHEVRTPLNGILDFAEIMSDPEIPDVEKETYKPMIQASCDRLINTISDYMDISQLMAGTMEVGIKAVNLSEMMTELTEKYQDLCRTKNVIFEYQPEDESRDIIVKTDEGLIFKIIHHLVDNAVKFTHEGSIVFGYRTKHSNVEIFVRDTGTGIAKEARNKIFEVFSQEDIRLTRAHEGSGLGLAIVKGSLNLLDGEIRFDSEEGKGTTFIVSIPRDIALKKKTAGQLKNFNPADIKNKIPPVLIAEDDFSLRVLQQTILENLSTKVFMAEDGARAVEMCKNHPEIKLVIMDLKMPDMDGFEATRQIKALKPELPVIAVSAYGMGHEKEMALKAGCDHFLTKPVSKQELIETVSRFIRDDHD